MTAKTVSSGYGRADGSSVPRTVLNLTMSAIGTSVFALPASFSKSGFIAVIPLLFVTWALSQYMMSLLYRCMLSRPGIRSYTDLGFAAGGRTGQLAVSLAMYLGLGAVCVGMILLMAGATASMSPNFKSEKDMPDPKARGAHNDGVVNTYKFVSAAVMGLLALLPTFKEVGLVSALGVFALVVTLITVIVASSMMFVKEHPVVSAKPLNFMEVCATFNMFMNGFTVAPVIPSLVLDMRDPARFGKVLTVGFAIISLAFMLIGYTYIGAGDAALQEFEAPALTEIIIAREDLGICPSLIQWGTVVICICHFLCLFAPIAAATDGLVQSRLPSAPGAYKQHLPVVLKGLARLAMVALCLAGSFVIPRFDILIGVIACTIVPLLQIVYPVWLFCRLLPAEAAKQRSLLAITVILGIFTVVVGLILTGKELARK